MKNPYFLVCVIIFSHFVYSSECENHFLDVIVRSIHSIQADLRSRNPEKQIKAIQETRAIRPDSVTINKWIIPFLKSENPQIRLSAVQVIGDGADLYPQFIGVLLLHLKTENSQLIAMWIDKRVSYIPSNVRQVFYQGHRIAESISQLDVIFNEMEHWFGDILSLTTERDIAIAINSVIEKSEKDRNVMEREIFKIYKGMQVSTMALQNSLMNIPHDTYIGFLDFLHSYSKYSNRPVYISKKVGKVIHFFYEHFYDIPK